jgi:tRNA A-37 threonylcarbamoyl transferase component Bud32
MPLDKTTHSLFEEETRTLLRKRLILLFSIGLFASAGAYVGDLLFQVRRSVAIDGAFRPWYDELFISHSVSFVIGLLAVWLFRDSVKRLQWTAFLIMAYNIIGVIFSHSAFTPQLFPLFYLAIMLFVPAAFLPIPLRFQCGLVAVALASFPLFQVYAANQMKIFSAMTDIFVLGLTTILVSKTLYNMRRRLLKAGNYFLREKLGEGGMGTVFVGEHALICRPTAIKVLKADGKENQMAIARFEREVRLVSMLTHPNTITILDYGRTSDNSFFYAMEFLEGMDLQKFVKKYGAVPAERAVYLLRQICGSLAEAHLRGITHRDIKPSNIFLTKRGGLCDFVKVLDFGLAKEIPKEGEAGLSKSGGFVGTPGYIAPEAIYGHATIDHRADIYNVGAVTYYLLTGQPLFASSSSVELLVDHVKTIPPKPSEVTELPIPPELDAIVMKCLAKAPEDRFQSTGELEDEIDRVPLESRWDQKKANAWWELHLNIEEGIHISFETGRVIGPAGRPLTGPESPKLLNRQDLAE